VTPDAPVIDSLAKQNSNTLSHFKERVATVITHFAEQSLNAALYYENKSFGKIVSLVPTSAKTGEGIPDLLFLLSQLTQHMLTSKLLRLSTLQCSILEVQCFFIESLSDSIIVFDFLPYDCLFFR
jgi:translation initiation factor 5B